MSAAEATTGMLVVITDYEGFVQGTGADFHPGYPAGYTREEMQQRRAEDAGLGRSAVGVLRARYRPGHPPEPLRLRSGQAPPEGQRLEGDRPAGRPVWRGSCEMTKTHNNPHV